MLQTHSKILKQSRSFYNNLANLVSSHIESDDEKVEYLKHIEKLLKDTVKNENLIKDAKKAVQPIQDQTNNNEDEESNLGINQIKQEFNGVINKYKRESTLTPIYNSDADIKGVKEMINQFQGTTADQTSADDDDDDDDDDDIRATQQDINLIDPISKKVMENPVRHTPCGHVYDLGATMAMIKQRKRKGFRCPTVGCQYSQPINPADLEEALDYKREILRRKRSKR